MPCPVKEQEVFVVTRYEHVVLDERDVAVIAGTNLVNALPRFVVVVPKPLGSERLRFLLLL